jgi:hypothetical protein
VSARKKLYNLIVTFREGVFDSLAYELERGRFGEYTAPNLMERFGDFSPAAIRKLKSIPTLFVYEAERGDARIGYLQRIRERNGSVLVEFDFDPDLPAFPASKLADLYIRLDIQRWEMNRTHWAIKEEDLLKVLNVAGVFGSSDGKSASIHPIEDTKFQIALSFPGEHREYVDKVVHELKRHLPKGAVFYDRTLLRSWLVQTLIRFFKPSTDRTQAWLLCFYLSTMTGSNGAV